jgi:uncharacterized protein DUF6480
MTTPDPDPRQTPGLRHGDVRPGDTPPAETSGTAGVSHREAPAWNIGSKASLIAIAVLAGLVAAMFAAMAIVWLSRL